MDKGGFYGQESTEVDDVVDQEDAEKSDTNFEIFL